MNFLNSYSFDSRGSFLFKIDTTNTSGGSSPVEEFELPLIANPNPLNIIVNWGDGLTSNITNPNQAEVTHTYASQGIYDVEITGEMSGFTFDETGDRQKILEISNWGIFRFDVDDTFRGCANLLITATDSPFIDTLRGAFKKANGLQIFDVSNWDLSNCTSLRETFEQAGATSGLLTFLDVTNWDVSNVTTMQKMIKRTNLSVFDTTNWNTPNLIDMKEMVRQNNVWDYSLANFDMSNVTDVRDLLRQSDGLSTINYDATLISWAGQTLNPNEQTDFGNSEYTGGGVAETARNVIINTYGWTITDGGQV